MAFLQIIHFVSHLADLPGHIAAEYVKIFEIKHIVVLEHLVNRVDSHGGIFDADFVWSRWVVRRFSDDERVGSRVENPCSSITKHYALES